MPTVTCFHPVVDGKLLVKTDHKSGNFALNNLEFKIFTEQHGLDAQISFTQHATRVTVILKVCEVPKGTKKDGYRVLTTGDIETAAKQTNLFA